ncbi:MAG: F0F1 ATP synthase subunit delta [Candidatus Spechtbacterales bacterium]
MAYSARHYAQALHELASTQTEREQKATAHTLFEHLTKEGRLGIASEIMERLQQLGSETKRQDTVRVASAEPMTEQQQKTIQEQFPASHYEFTTDESLIAGLVIQKSNSVWYANLAKATQQLRASIVR